jgi:hypothetical protein
MKCLTRRQRRELATGEEVDAVFRRFELRRDLSMRVRGGEPTSTSMGRCVAMALCGFHAAFEYVTGCPFDALGSSFSPLAN